ncbi:MAG: hypothetical protein LBT12_01985 [Oscillospiraceae bacterium]|jgi:regulator of replication initiation timing|nr:hypothetical protein [Oscillospiraceae bacterium]
MNNEEKILQILGELKADVSELKADVSGLKADVSELKEDVSVLKEDVSGLKQGQERLERGQARQEADLRELRIISERIDFSTRRLWTHAIEHAAEIKELKEM